MHAHATRTRICTRTEHAQWWGGVGNTPGMGGRQAWPTLLLARAVGSRAVGRPLLAGGSCPRPGSPRRRLDWMEAAPVRMRAHARPHNVHACMHTHNGCLQVCTHHTHTHPACARMNPSHARARMRAHASHAHAHDATHAHMRMHAGPCTARTTPASRSACPASPVGHDTGERPGRSPLPCASPHPSPPTPPPAASQAA